MRLGDVATIIMGQSPPSSSVSTNEGDTPLLTTGEFGKRYPALIRYTSKPLKMASKNDVLITVVGNVGGVNLGADCAIGRSVAAIRLSDDIDQLFLYYFLKSNSERLAQKSRGAIQKIIRKPQLEDIELPDFSIIEQKRIAAILDKANEIEQTTDKSDELKTEIIRSTYLEMFGDPARNPNNWQKEKLGNISNSILGKMLSPNARNMEPQYSYLANRNVRWRTFSLEDLGMMHFNDKETQKYSLEIGDVLICEGGEVGRCAVWRGEISNCYFQKALHRLRCNPDFLEPEFFVETMMLLSSQGALFASTSTATFSHLTGVRLKQLMIPIPPIDLQKKFVRILEQIYKIPSSSEMTSQNTSSIVQQLLN